MLSIKNEYFMKKTYIPLEDLCQNVLREHNAFECASFRAPLGRLFAQVAWPGGYALRQSTRLKITPSCPAGHVIGLGTFRLSAPDYFCPAIIGEKLEATDARRRWMECSMSYILCQLRLIHSRSINI